MILILCYYLSTLLSSSAQIVLAELLNSESRLSISPLCSMSPVISVKRGWKDFVEFVPLNSQFVCWHVFSSTRFQQVMLRYNFGLFINELIQNGVWKLNIMSMKIFRLSYIHCWGRFSEKSFSSFPSTLIVPSSKKLSSNM